ncbi:MAG: FtsX-like permease family protein [Bacteroidota bacterium]
MNVSAFIARRVTAAGERSFSRLIINIAIAAVAVSLAVMLVATAMMSGFKQEISSKIFGFWGHVHITDQAASFSTMDNMNYPIYRDQGFYPYLDTIGRRDVTWYEFRNGREIKHEGLTQGGIRHMQVFATLPTVMRSEDSLGVEMEGLILKGIGQDFDWPSFEQYLEKGETLRVSPDSISRDIFISAETARRMRLDVNDRVELNFLRANGPELVRVMNVVGIYKTGLAEYDRQFALIDIQQVQRLLGWSEDQVGGFEVFLDNVDDVDAFAEYLHFEEGILPSNLYAESISQKESVLFNWLDIQDYNQVIILTLMIIVAIINMITVLLILILERTHMVGTLKALGQSNWGIQRIFLYYAGYIMLFGLLWGNIIGLGLCWLQDTTGLIRLDEASYYLAVAPIAVNWWTVIALNVGTLGITLIVLILPSLWIGRIDAVKALRFR